MNKISKWRGLTTQVILFVILPITLVLILISFGSLTLHRDAMRIMVGERDKRTVRSASNTLTEQLNHKAIALQGLAIRITDEPYTNEFLTSANIIMPDFDVGLALYSLDGKQLAYSGRSEIWEIIKKEFSTEIDKLAIINPDTLIYSNALKINNEYIGLVIYQDSRKKPIAIGAFSISKLASQTLTFDTSMDEDTSMVLIDSFGNILFHSENNVLADEPYVHPGLVEGLNGESGTGYITENNIEHVYAYYPIPIMNWVLIMEEPWESVTSPILRFTEMGSIVLIPITLFALIALWLSARQIIQPLTSLEEKAGLIEWGNYLAINENVGGIEEIKSLQRTISHLAQRIQRSQRGLKDYISAITLAQEEERKRLARELHDESLQSVIALNQRIQMLKPKLTTPENIEYLGEIENMITETIQDLRRFTRALRPLFLEDLGLIPALEMLIKEIDQSKSIIIKFKKSGEEKRLGDEMEIAIYRIVQEAINNMLRHSNASKGNVSLNFHSDKVKLLIEDNGKGFIVPKSPSDFAAEGHFGLLGISERADLVGAEYKIDSVLGEGTKISIKVHINSSKH